MLNRISWGGDLPCAKPRRLRLSFKDKSRSEIDLLHRFVAHLNLPNFDIGKVEISENPTAGEISFYEAQAHEIATPSIANLFKRKWVKGGRQFKLYIYVIRLDLLGTNFLIDYYFEDRLLKDVRPQGMNLDEAIQNMMETIFEGHPNFLLSRGQYLS